MNDIDLESYCDTADSIILNLIEKFPLELKVMAKEVSCYLADKSERGEIWGMCTGTLHPNSNAFNYGYGSSGGGAIVIYVGEIANKCLRDKEDFKHWIESVYLHEFGHLFGLSEYELKQRDL